MPLRSNMHHHRIEDQYEMMQVAQMSHQQVPLSRHSRNLLQLIQKNSPCLATTTNTEEQSTWGIVASSNFTTDDIGPTSDDNDDESVVSHDSLVLSGRSNDDDRNYPEFQRMPTINSTVFVIIRR
jgi:hypothetical protein